MSTTMRERCPLTGMKCGSVDCWEGYCRADEESTVQSEIAMPSTTPMQRPTPKQRVLKKYPQAFGWRQFSVSDYTVVSGTGKELASAHYAKDAWAKAARNL